MTFEKLIKLFKILDDDGEKKILESIADNFGAEYIAEANVNNENWGGKK